MTAFVKKIVLLQIFSKKSGFFFTSHFLPTLNAKTGVCKNQRNHVLPSRDTAEKIVPIYKFCQGK